MRILLAAAALATARAAPCDILAAAGTPCAAAHSTTRSLFASFFSPLYQLKRFGDNATLDVLPLAPGGFTNASSHDAFCAANPAPPPPPPPPPPPSGLPPLGPRVLLQPAALPGFALRHCYSQGFVTPAADSGDDHAFTLRAALSGAAGAVSFQSVNFPAQWLAPMPGDAGRVGIVAAPEAGGASWAVAPAPGGGVTLIGGGGALVPGRNLTGTCAHSYAAPSASANVAPAGAGAAVWAVLPDAQGPSYPPRAACVISILYDQTGNRNHLLPASPAINNPAYDNPVNATRHPLRIGGGVKVYGAFFEGGMGYRARNTTAVARGNAPETLYMVTSGTHVNDGCCMDYGSSGEPQSTAARRQSYHGCSITHRRPPPAHAHRAATENDADNPGAFCDGCMEGELTGASASSAQLCLYYDPLTCQPQL